MVVPRNCDLTSCQHTLGCSQVRAEAYKALSSFTFSDLEVLEALRPLQAYARLLLDEINESARQQCIPLVESALEFEHSIRRRCAGQSCFFSDDVLTEKNRARVTSTPSREGAV